MEDKCIICGSIIPEGRQICRSCEVKANDSMVVYDLSDFRGNDFRRDADRDRERE